MAAAASIAVPSSKYFNEAAFKAALDAKQVSAARFDDACERILSGWYALPPAKQALLTEQIVYKRCGLPPPKKEGDERELV